MRRTPRTHWFVIGVVLALGNLASACGSASTSHRLLGPFQASATVLADGRVLFAGGSSGPDAPATASAQLFDPKTGDVRSTGSLTSSRMDHAAVRLLDGRVLIVGGVDSSDKEQPSAEIYDPSTGRFTKTGSPGTAIGWCDAVLLADGRVLVIDPSSQWGFVYDPPSGTFHRSTDRMRDSHLEGAAARLPDGRVLIAGGMDENFAALTSAEVFDPATDSFSPTGDMIAARKFETATPLQDGRVLVVGGQDQKSDFRPYAELYDPISGTFSPIGDSQSAWRDLHVAALLPDGRVLIAGGDNGLEQAMSEAETYDPATGRFSKTGQLHRRRSNALAVILQDGRVLIAGGEKDDRSVWSDAELFNSATGQFTLLD